MAKRGRPKKAGARNKGGRLVAAYDRGNDVVQARSASFACFQQGKADQQLGDQIGRAWAAGLLDGQDIDAAILRDAGRRYAQLYWHEYAAMAPKMGSSERASKGAANDQSEDRPGQVFQVLDRLVCSAGRDAMSALQDLCVNNWWFPDTSQPWVERMINSARRSAGVKVLGALAVQADHDRMASALQALLAITGTGVRPR